MPEILRFLSFIRATYKIYAPIPVILSRRIDRRNIFAVAIFLARRFYLKLRGAKSAGYFRSPGIFKADALLHGEMITCSGSVGGVITNSESLYQHRCRQFTLRIIGGVTHSLLHFNRVHTYTHTHVLTTLVCEDRYPVAAEERSGFPSSLSFFLKALLAIMLLFRNNV